MTGEHLHVMTVDVEEWFHICGVGPELSPERWPSLPSRVLDTTTRLLDLFDRTGTRATFFVLGYVAERHPALVRRIAAAGHEIASHGHMHRRVYELTPDAFARDLDLSLKSLADCGVTVTPAFRAPEWSINDRSLWALETLADRGVSIDSSMAPMRIVGNPDYPQVPHRLATPRGPIVECPPSVIDRFGQRMPFGGGWGLRMSRPKAVLRELERRARARSLSVFWVHPWEIDPEPPRIALPAGKRFAHYFKLDGFAGRLETILRDMTFGPLSPHVSGVRK